MLRTRRNLPASLSVNMRRIFHQTPASQSWKPDARFRFPSFKLVEVAGSEIENMKNLIIPVLAKLG